MRTTKIDTSVTKSLCKKSVVACVPHEKFNCEMIMIVTKMIRMISRCAMYKTMFYGKVAVSVLKYANKNQKGWINSITAWITSHSSK